MIAITFASGVSKSTYANLVVLHGHTTPFMTHAKGKGGEHTPHVLALHLISASRRHMNPRDRPNAIKEPLEGILSRLKRQVPDPYRVLTFLTFGIVCSGGGLGRRRLGLGFGVEVIVVVGWRAIVELAPFAWGLGYELVLFLPFLLPSPFGM